MLTDPAATARVHEATAQRVLEKNVLTVMAFPVTVSHVLSVENVQRVAAASLSEDPPPVAEPKGKSQAKGPGKAQGPGPAQGPGLGKALTPHPSTIPRPSPYTPTLSLGPPPTPLHYP